MQPHASDEENMAEAYKTLRLEDRRQVIIASARRLFTEQGFERTTLGCIVDHVGGSLTTIYKLFGNKDGLLEAVVFESAASGEAFIRDVEVGEAPPHEILQRIAQGLHAQFLDPEMVALVRIVMARSISDPHLARGFFERTATRTQDALHLMFENWQMRGIPMDGSPDFLAGMFMGFIVSDLQTEAISHGVGINHTPKRLRDRTDFFIRAAGIPANYDND